MHKNVKKDNRTPRDNGKTNFAMHLNFQGREIGREGFTLRKGEGHPVIEAYSSPHKNMTLASPIGIDGSEPIGKREETWGGTPRIIVTEEIMHPWGKGRRVGSRRKPVDKTGKPWERWNKSQTSSWEKPMMMTKMERSAANCCHGRKMGRNPSKHQTITKKWIGSKPNLTKTPKVEI